jgi:hypothetical protein
VIASRNEHSHVRLRTSSLGLITWTIAIIGFAGEYAPDDFDERIELPAPSFTV